MKPPSLTYLVSGVGGHNPGLSWAVNWILSHGLTRWFELFWAWQLGSEILKKKYLDSERSKRTK